MSYHDLLYLDDLLLEKVEFAKFFGLTINSELFWAGYIDIGVIK